MNCPNCNEEMSIGGKGTTRYYYCDNCDKKEQTTDEKICRLCNFYNPNTKDGLCEYCQKAIKEGRLSAQEEDLKIIDKYIGDKKGLKNLLDYTLCEIKQEIRRREE